MARGARGRAHREDVIETAKSRYTYSANLLAYPEAAEGGAERIALVGMGCMASAPGAMQARKAGKVARRLCLTIGLMCSKTFDDSIFEELFEAKYGIKRADIVKMNIKGVFQIWTKDGKYHEMPLKEAHAYTREGCKQCPDFAAEHADLSTGGIGAFGDWTLVDRAHRPGPRTLGAMKEQGLIETRPGDDDPGAVALLHKLARVSRKRWPATAVPAPGRLPVRRADASDDGPRPTTILFVRHGATATTGTVLPGRAPGLHLSEQGIDRSGRCRRTTGGADAASRARSTSHPSNARARPRRRSRKALRLGPIVERGLLECDFGLWTGKRLATLARRAEWRDGAARAEHLPLSRRRVVRRDAAANVGDGERDREAPPPPHRHRRQPRRSDQGGRHLRPRCAARPLSAHGHLAVLGERRRLHGIDADRAVREQHRFAEGTQPVVNYVFTNPDKVMVGVRGEVGNRLFLLQVREGRRLVIVKCEKIQLAALAEWIGQVLSELGRPGHLPEDFALEPEYETDFVAGDIAVSVDEDVPRRSTSRWSRSKRTPRSSVRLTREWAAGLAIAIVRLVEAGRPLCPLCGGPLDPKGHDCPRTNGHRAPIR